MFPKQGLFSVASRFFRAGPSALSKHQKAVIIDGHQVASKILGARVKDEIKKLSVVGVTPRLVAVLVGNVPESQIYVQRKKSTAEKVGIDCRICQVPEDIQEHDLLQIINKLNQDPDVHGVIVQLPLPSHLRESIVCNSVDASKDVDGFTASNLGKLIQGQFHEQRVLMPCTALAVAEIIRSSYPTPTKGLRAVVVGRSHNVGLPIAVILSSDGIKGGLDLSTTICHRYTPSEHLAQAVQQADIVVSAAGVPGLIRPEFVKPGACVIDVGITRIKGTTKLFGDVDPQVSEVAGYITPVPGGVGPCTVASLLSNTVQAAAWATFDQTK